MPSPRILCSDFAMFAVKFYLISPPEQTTLYLKNMVWSWQSRMLTPALFSKSIIFWRVRKIVKSDYWLCYVCPSVRPHGTVGLPLGRFSLNLKFGYFSEKLSRKFKFHCNLTWIKCTSHDDQHTFLTFKNRASYI